MVLSGFGSGDGCGFPRDGGIAQASSALIATIDGPHWLIVKKFAPQRLCFVDGFV
jgi:hypothetical protein